jgi:hypothetical protein
MYLFFIIDNIMYLLFSFSFIAYVQKRLSKDLKEKDLYYIKIQYTNRVSIYN